MCEQHSRDMDHEGLLGLGEASGNEPAPAVRKAEAAEVRACTGKNWVPQKS